MANYFQIFPPLVFSYRLFIFTNRGNFQSRTWVWRKFAGENRVKEGIGQESNGAANQEKQIFLLCQISPSASTTRDLGTRLHAVLSMSDSTMAVSSKYTQDLFVQIVFFTFSCKWFLCVYFWALIWSYIVDLFAVMHELASASTRTLLKLASSVHTLLKPYGDTLIHGIE